MMLNRRQDTSPENCVELLIDYDDAIPFSPRGSLSTATNLLAHSAMQNIRTTPLYLVERHVSRL
jgi:hypothetical protein